MALYESTFIARQDISTQDVERITDEFSVVLSENGGSVVKKEYWGLRNLAYNIGKNRKGHYVMLCIEASSDTINELQRKYKLSEDVVRNLTLKIDSISKDPSIMMENKDNKE